MAYQSVEIAQLRAQQEALDRQLAEAKERETRHALREIVQKMREYGITLNELMGRKPGEQQSEPTVKYRDPLSGATWSGRGRAPLWIAGKDRNEYLAEGRSAARAMVQAALFPEEH
ncbi:H-NS family nucleoid-associated regulatory protein [Caballeronia novacaledonica]|uniref:H-NS histone family protein n=1 Tax=Caballeronia novacaledonica TaxID=1544861 RepID=A0AA37MSK2_9BURK|nr:H-NS histone family protein [Caballeronia novacaledonica]GJH26292.1 H-NS histone family protein [Caballeronia novacaledonica]